MDEKDIRAEVEARVKAEAETQTGQTADDGITPEFVRECLAANELGDGTLYAALHRGRHIRNISTKDQWYYWGGHYWQIDKINIHARRAVDEVALRYLDAAKGLSEGILKALQEEDTKTLIMLRKIQEAFRKRANRLHAVAGANNCLEWASTVKSGLSIHEEDLDCNPWLLACRNGVLELKTGRFRAGRPEDRITKAVPHDWLGFDHPAPAWEKFLNEVFEDNTELIDYLRRALGYGITGLSISHIFLVLHGEGRNGKGTLVEMLKFVLGDLAKPIQKEMLLAERNPRPSSAHSSDIMTLKGLRVAFASETDKHQRFSPSKIKWYTGGDTLNARPAHAPYETTFRPTHLLCLLTNNLPHAPGDDFAFWQRLHLVPFKLKYVDDPKGPNERKKDESLPERLETEASGILAWLVRGCLEWQQQGMNPPLIVRAATENYRMNEDVLSRFIEARCYPPEDTASDARESFKELYASFKIWYVDFIGDEKHCPRKSDFSETLAKRFKKALAGGQVWFYGINLDPYKTND